MTFRLKCTKCGHVTTTDKRTRRCKEVVEVARGLNKPQQMLCWGMLARVERTRKVETDLDKAAFAEKQLALATSKMKRAVTSMELWARRRTYYLKKAEGMLQRAPRVDKPKIDRHTRAIVLD